MSTLGLRGGRQDLWLRHVKSAAACGIQSPDQRSNQAPLTGGSESELNHQGSADPVHHLLALKLCPSSLSPTRFHEGWVHISFTCLLSLKIHTVGLIKCKGMEMVTQNQTSWFFCRVDVPILTTKRSVLNSGNLGKYYLVKPGFPPLFLSSVQYLNWKCWFI